MKKSIGKVLVGFFLAITLNLFVLSKISSGQTIDLSWLFLSQLLSLLGTTLLSISFLLSSRLRFVEDWFGGLDKVYRLHHLTGGFSFALLLHHPLFLLINALPNTALGWKYLWLSDVLPYNWGVLSLYSLLLMLTLTLFLNLPYSVWKKTHELMGISLLFATLHILTISSDVSRYYPLRFWILLLLLVSAISVIYRRFLYSLFGPKYTFLINTVDRREDVLVIDLIPTTKKMKFTPGQFVFARFEGLGKETHPFSISSNEQNDSVRLAVKILGDFTLSMRSLKVGDQVTIWGPYGKFFEGALNGKDLVWVAGGIGVTPFLSLMTSKLVTGTERKVDFFYCVNSPKEAVFDQEIEENSSLNPSIVYHKYNSQTEGRIDAKKIIKLTGSLINKKVFLCGPLPMMDSLAKQFKSLGLKNRDIIFEDFNFK